jgi:hypothetical protein
MNFRLLSDLHLEFELFKLDKTNMDVLVFSWRYKCWFKSYHMAIAINP